MSANERGGLKAAFTKFNRPEADREAEVKLLGRAVGQSDSEPIASPQRPEPFAVATTQQAPGGLIPRPLLQREPVRQLSFRCPVSLASELRRKAAFNQLEQQEIIVEGLKRVLLELAAPPEGWQE